MKPECVTIQLKAIKEWVAVMADTVPVTDCDGEAPVCSIWHVTVLRQNVGTLLQVHRVRLAVKCGDVRVADN